MAEIVVADIEAYDPSISGTRTLRFATQSYTSNGRNALAYSEDFSNADWFKAAVTITAGQTSPLNDATAFTVSDSNSASLDYLQRTAIAYTSNSVLCWSMYIKKDGTGRATRFGGLRLSFGLLGASGRADISFDTATGESSAIAINAAGVTTLLSSGVIDDGLWWRVYIVASNDNATTVNPTLFPAYGASATWVTGPTATGSVVAWGAQLEPNALGAYVATSGTSAPDFYFYEGRIKQPANIQRDCFADGRTFGRTRIGYGDMILINNDGALDYMLDYSFAGRRIAIRLGTVSPNSRRIVRWTNILVGTMEQVELSWQRVTVRVRDRQQDLAQPLQQIRYAGGGATLEGNDQDLKGKPKPLVYGKVFNVSPPQVDTTRRIYQLHTGGTVSAVNAVYDRATLLTAGAVYASQADLLATAPTAGQYRVWNDATAGCFFRLGSAPSGAVTADVTGAGTITVGQLYSVILQKAGIASTDIVSADITALDAAVSYQVGVWASHQKEVTPLELLDELTNSVGAFYGCDVNGKFRIGRIVVPTGAAVGTITATEIISIERVASNDRGAGIPAWRVKIGYEKNNTIQTDLAATITDLRKAYLSQGYRREESSDAAVKTANLLSPELEFNTVLWNKADAAAEASRRLTIYKTRRDVYQVIVRVDASLASIIDLGAVITMQINRFGMSAGKKFLIIGIRTNMQGYQFDLTLWG